MGPLRVELPTFKESFAGKPTAPSSTISGPRSELGLLLATIGVHGVISYAVSRRTQEFGVRVALGAQKPDILRMVLGMGFRLVIIGVAVGCVAAVAAGRRLAARIWGVSPYDPLSFAVVIALLVIVGFQACLWPARRAARSTRWCRSASRN